DEVGGQEDRSEKNGYGPFHHAVYPTRKGDSPWHVDLSFSRVFSWSSPAFRPSRSRNPTRRRALPMDSRTCRDTGRTRRTCRSSDRTESRRSSTHRRKRQSRRSERPPAKVRKRHREPRRTCTTTSVNSLSIEARRR